MLLCSLQILNLHLSHPLIRPSCFEAGREAYSGDSKGGFPPVWEPFSFGGQGPLHPLGGSVKAEVSEGLGCAGPGQADLCLFWPCFPLLPSLLAPGQAVREVRQLVHTSVPGVRGGGVSSPAWQMAGLGSLETQKRLTAAVWEKGDIGSSSPPSKWKPGVGHHL